MDKTENLNKEPETIQKNQIEILRIKNKYSKIIKNPVDWYTFKLAKTEDTISKFKLGLNVLAEEQKGKSIEIQNRDNHKRYIKHGEKV